jgi:hypothetical protein
MDFNTQKAPATLQVSDSRSMPRHSLLGFFTLHFSSGLSMGVRAGRLSFKSKIAPAWIACKLQLLSPVVGRELRR